MDRAVRPRNVECSVPPLIRPPVAATRSRVAWIDETACTASREATGRRPSPHSVHTPGGDHPSTGGTTSGADGINHTDPGNFPSGFCASYSPVVLRMRLAFLAWNAFGPAWR